MLIKHLIDGLEIKHYIVVYIWKWKPTNTNEPRYGSLPGLKTNWNSNIVNSNCSMSQCHKYCLSYSRNIRPHYKNPTIAENCWVGVSRHSLAHSLTHSLTWSRNFLTSSLITWWLLSWSLFCLFVVWFQLSFVFAAELKPPTHINITISGNNITVIRTLPG